MNPDWSPRTIAVRGPGPHLPGSRPVSPPIHQTSTFEFESMEALKAYNETGLGHMYTRYENPTIEAAEAALAALEGAEEAAFFASGMAAIGAVFLAHLHPGEAVASMRMIYGGSYELLERHLTRLGSPALFLETTALADFERRLQPGTRLLYLESPTNPVLDVVDLPELAARAHLLGLLVVVDNTFATPVLQNPLALGADLVVHSATKYLSGHSDVVGGFVAGPASLVRPVREVRRTFGGSADPFAAWLLHRSLRTLPVRVEAQVRGAWEIARRLEEHPAVARVVYPGLPSHPHFALAQRQMRGPGAMITFEVEGGATAAERAMDRFGLVLRAASLGGVETLASMPVHTSNVGWPDEELRRAGISPGMIRLSVGLEDPADLYADIIQALG